MTTLHIGLTGSIGSGKSTVAKILQEQGAAIIDFDVISRRITASGGAGIEPIRREFGEMMIDADGALNRARMRDLIFQNSAAKQKLESITHTLIDAQAIDEAAQLALQKPIALVYDIPLLYGNSFWLDKLDHIVVVVCDYETQVQRVLQRNLDYKRETVEGILKAQATRIQLLEIANTVIDNSKFDINHLHVYTQVNILMGYLKRLCGNRST